MNKIVFYNNFHKGDLHLSRTMIRRFVQAFPEVEFEYVHKHGAYILKDVPAKYPGWRIIDRGKIGMRKKGDTYFFNTWYGSYQQKIQNQYGITFDSLYHVFEKHLNHLGTSWSKIEPEPKNLYPSIDWSHYNLGGVDKFVKDSFGKYRKNVLISNGSVLSGQSEFNKMNACVDRLTSTFTGIQFICTDRSGVKKRDNVAFADDVTGVKGCDLNEIAYLSTFCDVIIGRSSGPYTFAMIPENMFDKKKTMISFSSINSSSYWLGPMASKIKYEADVRNYNTEDLDIATSKIDEVLRR